MRTVLLTALCPYISAAAPSPAKPAAPKLTSTKPPAGPTAASSTEQPTRSANLHCFQCTGESTDPDDHCTDSGWVSIPHGQRLDYRYLCPNGIDDFCMKTIERWEGTRPGEADKYRTKRGCSGKTRTR